MVTSKAKKHICMIAYTDYLGDGRVRREAESIAATGKYDVRVIALKRGPRPDSYAVDNVTVMEMNQAKYSGSSRFKYLSSYFNFILLSFVACTKLFLDGKIDLVHVHNMPDLLIFAAIVPRLFGRKLVLDIHDTVPETYFSKFRTHPGMLFRILCLEELVCCSLAHKVIAVNHVQRDELVRRGIPAFKVFVSMNVPDDKRFHGDGSKPSNDESRNGFKLVYHGTVTKRLGIDLAIRALSKLVDQIADLEFHLWEKSGEYLGEVIQLGTALNVADRLRIIKGGVPYDELPKRLAGMDVGIVANRKDAATELMLPVKLMEYIAMDIPVVAPRLRGIQYYFSDDMVSFFEPENVESMANAILALYRNEKLRKVQAGKAKSFLEIYGWQKQKQDLIDFYDNLFNT